jgi:hypothetical protein
MREFQIKTVETRKHLREFIMLPAQLHKGHQNWVPPIYRDEWSYFNKKQNLAFCYCNTTLALAYRGNELVGRIMGINNRRYNSASNEKTARFSHFECVNEPSVAHELFLHIENWSVAQGLTKIMGPFGMNYHDPMGFILEGFDHSPAISTYQNFEYLLTLIEQEGYLKEEDLVVYKIPIKENVPDFYQRIQQKVQSNPHIRKVNFRTDRDMKSYILPVLKLFNETFSAIRGYSQLDEEEMKRLARHYLPALDHRFVKVVEYDGEVAGFIIAMPNISKGIIASGGRLFPFGFSKIIQAQKQSKQLDLLIGGISEKYRGLGIDVLMGLDIIASAREAGFEFIDSHLELESNVKVRAEMEKQGSIIYKRYRIFQKDLLNVS